MPTYRVEFAAGVERDFELIFDFLEESYRGFGENTEDAIAHAGRRVEAIRATAAKLGENAASWNDASRDHAGPPACNYRSGDLLTPYRRKSADCSRARRFFGGSQNHVRQMLARLLRRP